MEERFKLLGHLMDLENLKDDLENRPNRTEESSLKNRT